eukprot:5709027-Pleurochrysis_carterae.AAC.2
MRERPLGTDGRRVNVECRVPGQGPAGFALQTAESHLPLQHQQQQAEEWSLGDFALAVAR